MDFYEIPYSNISKINMLDDNYALDFYEKYYEEKNQGKNKNYNDDDMSLDRSSELGKKTILISLLNIS